MGIILCFSLRVFTYSAAKALGRIGKNTETRVRLCLREAYLVMRNEFVIYIGSPSLISGYCLSIVLSFTATAIFESAVP